MFYSLCLVYQIEMLNTEYQTSCEYFQEGEFESLEIFLQNWENMRSFPNGESNHLNKIQNCIFFRKILISKIYIKVSH